MTLGQVLWKLLVFWSDLLYMVEVSVANAARLSKCHKAYTSIILDKKLYHKEMGETTNKYKLPAHFSKAKLALPPYSSNIFTFLQFVPHLLNFT